MVGGDLRTRAQVLAVVGDRVAVEACAATQCANCPGGCNWGGFRGPRQLSLALPPGAQLVPGDSVWISLTRASMLRGAGLAYGLTFLGLFAGAAVGNLIGGDGTALALALAGLGVGWWVARWISRRSWSEPRITLRVGGQQ